MLWRAGKEDKTEWGELVRAETELFSLTGWPRQHFGQQGRGNGATAASREGPEPRKENLTVAQAH